MESQPQNPEFRNNPENLHACTLITVTTSKLVVQQLFYKDT